MLKADRSCQRCALHKDARTVCLMGIGPQPAKVMILGEAPGAEEDQKGQPFIGKAGQLLTEMLTQVGIDREKVYISNAVKCRPPDNRTPTASEIKACRVHLQREIDAVQPEFILLLGNVPLKSVLDVTGITKHRGRAIKQGQTTILPTLHPASIFYHEANKPIIQQDFRYFLDIWRRGFVPKERGLNPIIVDTPTKVDEMLAALTGIVSFDIETTDLYPWKGEITAIGFGTAVGEFTLFPGHKDNTWSQKEVVDILRRAEQRLHKCFLVAQNGKFDQLWLRVHYGINLDLDFDTMLAHYLLDENQYHDLEYLARLYFGAPAWDIPLEEKQGKTSIPNLARYLAHDLYYARNLFFRLNDQLGKDPQLAKLYRHLLMPLSNLFVRMEEHGAYINVEGMEAAKTYLRSEIVAAKIALNQYGRINWASPKQIGELLYGKLKLHCPMLTAKGAKSTAESALNQIDHPIISHLKRLRAARQENNFFIKGWRPYLVGHRLHPNIKLHGTTTGRPSAEHPNLQQTTREKRVRSLLCAPEGWELMEADLSQIELRLIAEASKDPTMMQTFRDGKDIHWRTALAEIERGGGEHERVLKTASTLAQRTVTSYGEGIRILLDAGPGACEEVDKFWKNIRYGAKAVNFGFCLAEGQLVLTDVGLVPIEQVQDQHRVWDGVEWVHHDGVIFMGKREVLTYDGLTATPDHVIYTEDGEQLSLDGAAKAGCAIGVGARGTTPITYTAFDRKGGLAREMLRAGPLHEVQSDEDDSFGRALPNEFLSMRTVRTEEVQQGRRPESQSAQQSLWSHASALLHGYTSLVSALQGAWHQSTVQVAGGFYSMGLGQVAGGELRGETVRQAQQQWPLQQEEPAFSHCLGERSKQTAKVYDLMNAGPRHRFTVSGKIVSNCYGMWYKKFRMYARDTYSLDITDRQAQESRNSFFQLYTKLEDWHATQKRMARTSGYVRALDGQKRRLPDAQKPGDSFEKQEAFRQAINAPIQCFAAKINLMVLLQMAEEFDWSVFRPVITVHDAILAEVRIDAVEKVAKRIVEVMRHPKLFDVLGIKLSVPLDGDCKLGPWGNGISVNKWLEQRRGQQALTKAA